MHTLKPMSATNRHTRVRHSPHCHRTAEEPAPHPNPWPDPTGNNPGLLHHRQTTAALAAATLLAVTLTLLTPTPAYPAFTPESPLVNGTAYTLQKSEFQIGVWDISYGPFSWLTLSSYIWPWLVKVPSLAAKVRFWHNDTWAFSWKLGFFSVDIQDINKEAAPAKFRVIPSELTASYRLGNSLELSLSGIYTPVVLEGSYEANDLQGAAGYSNVQLALMATWKMSDSWALWLRTRHLLSIDASATASATHQIDPYTKLTVHADANVGEIAQMGFPQTMQLVPGIAYSGSTFNVELGLGYGSFNIPGINFMIPQKSIVPFFDMYWRF